MKIKVLVTIRLAREARQIGSVLDIDDEAEALRLIATGAAEAVDLIEQLPVLSEDEQFFVSLSAKDAIEFIAGVDSFTQLSAFARLEETRKTGPRKTVTEAFAARGADLQAAAQADA